MNNKKIVLRNLAVLALIVSSFIACDKDFASIDSDIINNDNATHFDTESIDFEVIAYSKALDPVQTNNLPISLLGVYNDALYGNTTASVVTQISSSTIDPDFGENVILDSVVLTIPLFSTAIELTEDGETIYELDSIFGSDPIKLSIHENNYFLRDFDPNSEINDPQNYFSDGSTGIDNISSTLLEGTLIYSDDEFKPSPEQIRLEDQEGEPLGFISPAIRVRLTSQYWIDKIINKAGEPELSNQNNFNDYFRGLYFKAESTGPSGNLTLLNLSSSSSNITLYYTKDPINDGDDRDEATYTLTFTGNRVNFLSNDFILSDGDAIQGDEKLYLKGGEGSMAVVKLFNGDNIDIEDPTLNTFETFKNDFVVTDENEDFVSSKRLVNEANLVFYVDESFVNEQEPERIYLYDIDNAIPLVDYFVDITNNSFPNESKINHLGKLQHEGDEPDGQGIKYKIKITEHINNLLLKDSTNVKLGLVVSGNVNLEGSIAPFNMLTGTDTENKIPVSSIITPRGTVLYGNNTVNEEKKVYLEVFYTEPNN